MVKHSLRWAQLQCFIYLPQCQFSLAAPQQHARVVLPDISVLGCFATGSLEEINRLLEYAGRSRLRSDAFWNFIHEHDLFKPQRQKVKILRELRRRRNEEASPALRKLLNAIFGKEGEEGEGRANVWPVQEVTPGRTASIKEVKQPEKRELQARLRR
jgi:hypothetical protein